MDELQNSKEYLLSSALPLPFHEHYSITQENPRINAPDENTCFLPFQKKFSV